MKQARFLITRHISSSIFEYCVQVPVQQSLVILEATATILEGEKVALRGKFIKC